MRIPSTRVWTLVALLGRSSEAHVVTNNGHEERKASGRGHPASFYENIRQIILKRRTAPRSGQKYNEGTSSFVKISVFWTSPSCYLKMKCFLLQVSTLVHGKSFATWIQSTSMQSGNIYQRIIENRLDSAWVINNSWKVNIKICHEGDWYLGASFEAEALYRTPQARHWDEHRGGRSIFKYSLQSLKLRNVEHAWELQKLADLWSRWLKQE